MYKLFDINNDFSLDYRTGSNCLASAHAAARAMGVEGWAISGKDEHVGKDVHGEEIVLLQGPQAVERPYL